MNVAKYNCWAKKVINFLIKLIINTVTGINEKVKMYSKSCYRSV